MDSFIESMIYLSIYKILIEYLELKDIKNIIHEYYKEYMEDNKELLLSTGIRMFTNENIDMLRESAYLSEEIKFKDDYIVEFLDEKENSYNFGNNTHKCPINDFFIKHNASDLMIHICELDYIRSEYMKSGLDRKYCLAKGDRYCSFRWNKGKKPIWR
ncbi:MAG: L-2-amino-thiazoline-4-carboxylic acid hydrolase [Defluviitaleaceae bacterium]|nr:L-2-amino-thiazoline-4-carboxylic acid hydrolase [Defluviitaleaceae bacterium]